MLPPPFDHVTRREPAATLPEPLPEPPLQSWHHHILVPLIAFFVALGLGIGLYIVNHPS